MYMYMNNIIVGYCLYLPVCLCLCLCPCTCIYIVHIIMNFYYELLQGLSRILFMSMSVSVSVSV